MRFPQVDNAPMDLLSPGRRWARPAVVALALAALTAVLPLPARAAPDPSGPERSARPSSGPRALAAARAEAARLRREVGRLDVKVGTPGEWPSAAPAPPH